MLEIRALSKSYGQVVALDGVDLEVERGEIVGLLGPNGAGKTTVVSIVAGLRRADAGTVQVAGIDALRRPQEARRHIGLAPQDLGIYPILTVRENLIFFGELADLGGRELAESIEEVGAALGLPPLFGRLARNLSGGEKKRLHTAIALLGRPPLLLLDEPTTGADVGTRADVLAYVRTLADKGSAVLYSTHYLPEVESLGASVAIIDRGRIIARGTLADLIAAHGTSALEMAFEGPAPYLDFAGVVREDSLIRIPTERPASVAAEALTALGSDAGRLLSIEIVRPSLDSVFLGLTGRHYEGEDSPPSEESRADAP